MLEKQKKFKGGFAFILAVIMLDVIFVLKKIYDTDYFWHLRVGEFIFINKRIPVNDIYSWYGIKHNLDWFSHEWLSELFLYTNYRLFGHIGNIVFVAIAMSLIILILYITNKDNFFKNIYFSFAWFLLFIVGMNLWAVPRPQIFSFLLTTISMYILNKYRNEDTKAIWILPIISLLWVNLHGGSSALLFVLIGITIFSGLFDFTFLKVRAVKLPLYKVKLLVMNLILCIGTATINPKGFRMLAYPFINMADKFVLTTIDEWRCPDLKNIGDFPIFLIIGVVIITLMIVKEELDLFDIIITLAFTYLTLKSIRFEALLLPAVTPIMLKYIPGARKTDIVSDLKYPMMAMTVFLIFISITTVSSLTKSPIDRIHMPSEKSVEVIKIERPERILNYYTWGGYLIYKDAPVFVDGRADLYSNNIYPDYIDIDLIHENFKALLNKYDFDMIIYPKSRRLALYLEDSKNYKLIYSDETTVIYKKAK